MICYFPRAKSEWYVDAITFFSHNIPFPELNTKYFLKQTALDILSISSNIPLSLPISLDAGDSTKNDLFKIAKSLGSGVSPPKPSALPTVTNSTKVPRVVQTTNTSPPGVYKKKTEIKNQRTIKVKPLPS